MAQQQIVFFDGYCVLCNGFVDFLIRADKKNRLKFASLQGNTAKAVLDEKMLLKTDTVIFKDSNDKIYIKSAAVLKILDSFGSFWKIFQIFSILPAAFRDTVYNWVAKNRFDWFGKRDSCRLPSPEEKEKILD